MCFPGSGCYTQIFVHDTTTFLNTRFWIPNHGMEQYNFRKFENCL